LGRPLPELSRLPLVGNLAEFRRDRVALLRRLLDECGEAGAFHLGPRRVAVFASRQAVREVLFDHADAFEKGPIQREIARPVLGDGLISIESAQHLERRRMVQPAFTMKHLAAHADVMVECIAHALDGLSDGQELDVAAAMTALTLRIIGRTLFSVDLIDDAPELAHAFERVLHYVTARLALPIPIPRWAPTPTNLHTKRALRTLDGAIARMVDERKAGGARHDLLSVLVESELSPRQIRDEVMTLFVAGHETVATALGWTWHLLMQHPDAYQQVCDEVDALAAPPRFADLARLPFSLACVKEAMRLYPPVHSLGRQPTRDVEICGFEVPEGTPLLISLLLMQRREDYFARAAEFAPERFADEERWPKHSYLPFGAGARQCIGNHFGLSEAHLVIATLARRVRFEPRAKEIAPDMHVTLRPKGGVPSVIRLRR
jgi:cytochrome P450